MLFMAMKFCPAEQMLNTAKNVAACPEEVSMAPTPPSKSAIFASTAATVGLEMRVYIWPSALRSKSSPSLSASSYW